MKQTMITQENIIKSLLYAISLRDPYTTMHMKSVATIATYIANELGMTQQECLGIKLAALVHDIGKLGVPLEILIKPARLTSLEMELMKQHPQMGFDILNHINWDWPIREVALQHHERLDGSGYPNGLKGDEIFHETRIVSVADAVDSMISHRPYRAEQGMNRTMEILDLYSDTHYDRQLCEIAKQYIMDHYNP